MLNLSSLMKLKVNQSHEDFWFDQERWVVSYGGAGSGKSFTTAQKIISRLMSEDSHRFLVVRKVAKTLRVSVFQLFKDLISMLGVYDDFAINKTDMTITYKPNGSQLLFFGLDDIEKLKSIQGITAIWIEEASECEQGDVLELNRRLRGFTQNYKQIILTFNPISHLHWLKAHFFDNPNSTASIYKTTYKDNAFIDDEYKAELEDIKNYDIQQYNIYALGDWGVLNDNVVYHNFDPKKHWTDLTINDFTTLHCGIDFNVEGSVCVMFGIRENKAYAVDGWAVHDTQEIINKLLTYKQQLVLYPDSTGRNRTANAARSSIDLLEQQLPDARIDAPSTNGAIRDRVNCVNRLLAADGLLINDKKLERLIFSLQTQAYDKAGKPEKFTVHKEGAVDDWLDSTGYFVARRFPIESQIKSVKIKFAN